MLEQKKGIVFVIDGAGGSGFLPFVLSRILPEAGLEMNHFRWSAGYMRIIKDLTNRDTNRKKASELASVLRNYRLQFPEHQLHLVAKSAGTAIALWAMTELEPLTLDRVVLLSPAVSPVFPLDDALRAARQDVYSFWSPADVFFLDWGTSLFGTADGVYGRSAGLVGFARNRQNGQLSEQLPEQLPEQPSEQLSELLSGQLSEPLPEPVGTARLCEVKWAPSMISSLHVGDHSGTSMPPFIRKYVMPLLSPDLFPSK
jgi:hypothetical protein